MNWTTPPTEEAIEWFEEWRKLQDHIKKENIHAQKPSPDRTKLIMRTKELDGLLKKVGYFR